VTVTLGNFADSRLGEAISPERDSSSLKKQPLAWAKVRAEKFGRASTILAWARRARLGENISSRPCSRIHGSTPNQKYIFQPFPCEPNSILTHTRAPEVNQAKKYLKEQEKLASLTLSGSTEVH